MPNADRSIGTPEARSRRPRPVLPRRVLVAGVGALLATAALANVTPARADDSATPANPATSAAPAPAAGAPDLTGTWNLDRARSDDPAALRGGGGRGGFRGGGGGGMRGGMGGGGLRGGGGRRGGFGGGAEGGGPGEGGPDRREGGGPRGMLQPAKLILDQHDTLLDFYDESRRVRSIGWGATPDTGNVMHGAWKGRTLVADFAGPGGREVNQAFEISADGATLTVVTHLTRPDGTAAQLKSVYSHYDGASP